MRRPIAIVLQKIQRLRRSPRFPYVVFLVLLLAAALWNGHLYWQDFHLQTVLKRNGGMCQRRPVLSPSWKDGIGKRLLEPLQPITSVVLRPTHPVSESDFRWIISPRGISAIGIYGPLSPGCWSRLGALQRLQTIDADFTGPGPDAADLAAIGQLPRLTVINFRNLRLESTGLGALGRLPNLRRLKLDHISIRASPAAEGDDATAQTSEQLHTRFSAEAFRDLSCSTCLKELDIMSCPGFQDEHLLALTGPRGDEQEPLPELTSLTLERTGITSRGLRSLGNLRHLFALNLTDTKIDDGAIKILSGISSLRVLILDGTLVSDDAVATLAGMNSLESLSLDGARVTEQGLLQLINSQVLRRLMVSDGVSEETLLKLRQHFAVQQR